MAADGFFGSEKVNKIDRRQHAAQSTEDARIEVSEGSLAASRRLRALSSSCEGCFDYDKVQCGRRKILSCLQRATVACVEGNDAIYVRRLEMLLQEGKDELSDPKFYQKLADEFNAQGRIENKNVQMQQVQRWFQSRLNIEKTVYVSSPSSSQDTDPTLDDDLPNNALQCIDLPEDNYVEISEGLGMEFEAKSYRDQAWYDVSTFLAHRVLCSGEVEVRVRFAGFGPEEDEWVDAAKAVRDRSIPMEASECWRVNEGDILLCFREKDEAAYHFDACVVSIERKIHDARGCRCNFFMRYVHDQVEEIVHLNQLCRRP